MTVEVVTVTIGDPDYERYLGPILDNPAPEIRQDADIDMRREAQQDPSKRWWIAVVGQQVVAWCAAWHDLSDRYDIICGHNYEYGWRTRQARYWSSVHVARQRWLVGLGWTAWTVVHDEPLDLHIATGWRRLDAEGTNPAEMGGQHWQELNFHP